MNYTLNVLGLEISFKTDAGAERVQRAKEHVEDLYSRLNGSGRNISKEMLLTVLALSIADDYLETKARLHEIEDKLGTLLKIE